MADKPKNEDFSTIAIIPIADGHADKVANIFQKTLALDPSQVRCMMQLIVISNPEEGPDAVKVSGAIIGDDEDIAKMFCNLAEIAKEGIQAMHAAEQNTTNEVKH